MSAIVGIIDMKNEQSILTEHMNGMMESLRKYPSDDRHTWKNRNVFLGCHSQWITPESVGEKLPYYDQDRKLAITSDAIIDNRMELLEMLRVSKVLKDNMPDSKIILLAYEKWGEDCPRYLIGDFAFMIWDERNQKLFGARDFSGMRTIYYHHRANIFAFSTTIHALLSLPYINRDINDYWVAEYLAIPGVHESTDYYNTVYKHVFQIPPSHSIVVKEGEVKFSKYCDITNTEKKIYKSDTDYIGEFQSLFHRAVKDRLRVKSKVGAQLSGGLDSGSVCSFAANTLREQNMHLETFSYIPVQGFEDWTPKSRVANEKPLIKSTANFVGNINAHYYDFQGKSPLSEVNKWLDLREMPYKSFSNSFWTKGIYEEAKKNGVNILLKGSRGNYTISHGSALFEYSNLMKNLKWIKLFKEVHMYSKNTGVGRKKLLSQMKRRIFNANKVVGSYPSIINPNFANGIRVKEKLLNQGIDFKFIQYQDLNKARMKQFEQLFFWNLNGINATQLSLKYGLWERDPTNDLRVVKFCLSLPDKCFVNDGLDRALIRKATKNYLPDEIRLNQKVRGVQGADVIYRMKPEWQGLIHELKVLQKDPLFKNYINEQSLAEGITHLEKGPKDEYVFDPVFKNMMRCLILHRFMTRTA